MKGVRLGGLVMVVLALAACKENTTAPPTTGTLRGTITFHGEWPYAGADSVNVSLFASWPPAGPPIQYVYVTPPANPSDTVHIVDFEIRDVDLGTYHIAAGWHSFLLGYGGEITVSESTLTVEGIQFDAAFDTLYTRKITGSLNIQGTWPDTATYLVYVATGATPWNGTGWDGYPQSPPRMVVLHPGQTTFTLDRLMPTVHTAVAVFVYNLSTHAVTVAGVLGGDPQNPQTVDLSTGDATGLVLEVTFP